MKLGSQRPSGRRLDSSGCVRVYISVTADWCMCPLYRTHRSYSREMGVQCLVYTPVAVVTDTIIVLHVVQFVM
jgi:hypothetical protein